MRINRIIIGALAPLAGALLFAPGQVAAQAQSASAAAMLEEIVVTARRREENLQELPLSIQAITSDAMQAQGIYNMEQISEFVPNLILVEDQRANDTRLFIRGLGGGFSNPAQVFGVGMYIDGHYLAGSLGAFMSTLDLERVEILRGPQGTLFGKNTTGGALSLISAKPGPEFDSSITLRAADFGEVGFRGMVNVPLSDNVFFRGVYATEESDGYWFNNFSAFNADTGGEEQESLGLALRFLAGDHWTIDAAYRMSEDRDQNSGGQCRARPGTSLYNTLIAGEPTNAVNPGAFFGPDGVAGGGDDIFYTGPGPFTDNPAGNWGGANLPIDGGLRIDAIYSGATAQWLNECEANAAAGPYVTTQNMNTRAYVDNDMYTLDVTWDSDGAIGPFAQANVQLKFADRETNYFYQQDRDFGRFTIDHIGNAPFPGSGGILRETTEFEVIFNADIGENMNLTLGAYSFEDDAGTPLDNACVDRWFAAYDPDATAPGSTLAGTINGLEDDNIDCVPEGGTFFHRLPDTTYSGQFTNQGRSTGESDAIYGHLAWTFTEMWELGLGFRSMEDTRTQAHIEGNIVPGTCTHNNPGDNSPLDMCTPLFQWNRATLLDSGITWSGSSDFSETTGLISLTRHLTAGGSIDNGMFYGTISEGYLHGAFNDEINATQGTIAENQAAAALIPYGPEFVTNYEIGFKGTFYDGRLSLNADIFFMDYTDKQEEIRLDNSAGLLGPDQNFEYTVNAGAVDITGLELELRAVPWEGGFVSLDLGVLDTEYSEFLLVDILNPTDPAIDRSGQSIDNLTPDWTLTASVEHAFLLGNGGTLTPQLGLYMQDDLEWLPRGNQDVDGGVSTHCHQDAYEKWRVRATYVPEDGSWQASLFGYNITDEEILYRCNNVRSGAYGRWLQPPAQWGVEFSMSFGAN